MARLTIQNLPSVGLAEATRLYGLTARAIRYYEERGLLEATRDRRNHRYFDAAARRRLEWFGILRPAGLSLADIEAVFDVEAEGGDGRACALARLKGLRGDVHARLARADEAIAHLREGLRVRRA
jgi:DNA-binding transcriptional MerR regulator